MSGSGNDFIMLDGRSEGRASWPGDRVVRVCDRRLGVGADGLVILTPAGPGTVRMDFFNSDGSEAAMCGNAALCSTVLAARLGLAEGPEMSLATGAGTFRTRATGPDRAALNLPPTLAPEPASIPLEPGESGIWHMTVGVPHLVVLVEDVEKEGLMDRGRALRWRPEAGPAGSNVNFVTRASAGGQGPGWRMRTFERGVEGETLACGTGAVACGAVLAYRQMETLPVRILSRSGRPLEIGGRVGQGGFEEIWLSGEGRLVFSGTLAEP